MRLRIMQYNRSRGARELAQAINSRKPRGMYRAIRLNLTESRSDFVSRPDDIIINWGKSGYQENVTDGIILNKPNATRLAGDKIRTFEALRQHNISIPEFTTDRSIASNWLNEGSIIVARTVLNGHSGRGIVIVEGDEELPHAPLYTKYIKKQHEYRVHVLGDKTYVRQKRRREDCENPNWRIRSHNNGFIFAQNVSYIPEGIEDLSRSAINALGLDFGAVDIIFNESQNRCYVLEVNTAPGLEGSTSEYYADYFINKYKEIHNV